MDRPPMFDCKKWTIVVLTGIAMVLTIIMVIFMCVVAGKINDNQEHPKETKTAIIAAVIVIGLLNLLFSSIGFFGALKEHYCLSMTYCVLAVISLIGQFANAIRYPSQWAGAVLQLIIVIILILFVRDLRTMRNSGANYA